MAPGIDRCIVFDDNPDQLRYRVDQVDRMLGRLIRAGELDLRETEVSGHSRRVEVLEELQDCDGDAPALLLADMAAEQSRFRGNIGARLVRAIAQHPQIGASTYRIVWSRQTVTSVTDELARWTHATATYMADSTESLADAVRHALSRPVGDPDSRQFPAARTVAQWEADVRDAVEELVGEENRLEGDDIIAQRLFEGVTDDSINERLARIETPHHPNAMAFVKAVQAHNGLSSPEEARRLIEDVMGPVAEDRVDDAIYPAICDSAWDFVTTLKERELEYGAYLATTWLTPGEEELMSTFLSLYKAETAKAHGNNQHARTAAVNRILGITPGGTGTHLFTAAAERLALGTPDLAYALWTMTDIQANR
jgi:hypothetical protein